MLVKVLSPHFVYAAHVLLAIIAQSGPDEQEIVLKVVQFIIFEEQVELAQVQTEDISPAIILHKHMSFLNLSLIFKMHWQFNTNENDRMIITPFINLIINWKFC